ncbi:MAG TPA: pitrilysin family protein [Blastocatellia bacterium]|nr:pitrilysin family protein [Blastocatellia bacterium]
MITRRSSLAVNLAASLALLSGVFSANSWSAGAGFAQQSEQWRNHPPTAGPARPLALPAPKEFKLTNGLTVLLVEDHRAPVVSIEAAIPVRIDAPPIEPAVTTQVTLAEATAELLSEGAGGKTSQQLAQEVELLGGRLDSGAREDYCEVSADVISENVQRMIQLVADVVLRPSFPEREIELFKDNRLDKLKADRQDPAYLAGERFDRVVFGVTPYGITSPNEAAVNALNRQSLLRFYRRFYTPAGSVLAIAGDFDTGAIEGLVRRSFSSWDNAIRTPVSQRAIHSPTPIRRTIDLIDRPGSEQADLRIGGLTVPRAHPDYFPLLVADAVLGGGTSSRLFLNIREKKGYAYDVSSYLFGLRWGGDFYGSSQTRTDVAVNALKEMLAEFERLRNEPVPADELRAAKNYLEGLFSLSLGNPEGVLTRLVQIRMTGLKPDWLQTYIAQVEQVSPEKLMEVARKYINPGRAVIVVVGDAQKLRKPLSDLGTVRVLNLQGKPIVGRKLAAGR